MIEHKYGIHIRGSNLWLDAERSMDCSFISHAHIDHTAKHRKIIASDKTTKLYEHRIGKVAAEVLEYNRPVEFEDMPIEIFPAGHVLGSAQILIQTSGKKIIYTGDFKVKESLTVEKIQVRHCDILIMECTYGHPRYSFPPTESLMEDMARFVEDCFHQGAVPIFLAYALGKGQEAMKMLGNMGYELSVHDSVYRIAKIYEQFGITFGKYQKFNAKDVEGKVLIITPHAANSKAIQSISRSRRALLSGWALDGKAEYMYKVDEAFPLSDHADFEELIDFVRQVGPELVYTTHGFDEFPDYLKEAGFKAKPLRESDQLRLFDD